MARLSGGPAREVNFDALPIDQWLSNISDRTPGGFVAAPAANFQINYAGLGLSYDANGNVIAGAITEISVFVFGTLWLEIADLHLAATVYRNFVADDDTQGFLSSIFSGDDRISRVAGGSFGDLLDGFAGNDTLSGSDGRDTLRGGIGNDRVFASDGDDKLEGGAGNDTLDGDLGADTMIGGAGNDRYFVNTFEDRVDETGGSGIDLVIIAAPTFNLGVEGFGAIENMEIIADVPSSVVGNDLDNSIRANGKDNAIAGGGGNDTIDGGGGTDRLNGDAGADKLSGGDGNDSLTGGTGRDTLIGGSNEDNYTIDDDDTAIETQDGILGGNDTVHYVGSKGLTLGANLENLDLVSGLTGTGNGHENRITGNISNNRLSSLAGDDTLDGRDGNDTLDGGPGADTMIGGAGSDTYIVDNALDVVTEDAAALGIDTVRSSVSFGLPDGVATATSGIEDLILTGNGALNGTGNKFNNRLIGNAGKNVLSGLDGGDTLTGGAGADTLIGGEGNDTYDIDSLADKIVETGASALDIVRAATSIDLNLVAFAGIEGATLTGTRAINATGTGTGNELTGNSAANRLFGGGGFDLLIGGSGNDTLDGGTGDDILAGGAGNDTYFVDGLNEIVLGEQATRSGGVDTVFSSLIDYTLSANIETLVLAAGGFRGRGNDLSNSIVGNDAGNELIGNGGNDTLTGNGGFDTLDGRTDGIDLLIGGAGDDLYRVSDGDRAVESLSGTAGGTDSAFYDGSSGFTLGANIENLTLVGTTGSSSGTGNALSNIMSGNNGDNLLSGLTGSDWIIGYEGDDTLDGGAGADVMIGGKGYDTYIVDNILDVVDESTGDDFDNNTVYSSISFNLTANGTTVLGDVESLHLTGSKAINGTGTRNENYIFGNEVANVLDGGGAIDALYGRGGNDSLIGGDDSSWDILEGGTGADTMAGGDGGDDYYVDNARDVVDESSAASIGSDRVIASVNFTLAENVEELLLTGRAVIGNGNSEDNYIFTIGSISNKLFGAGGIDKLEGGGGNDTLDGGAGSDTLYGEGGNDTYLVDSAGDVVDERFGSGIDTVIASDSYSLLPIASTDVENLTLAAGAGNLDGTGNGLSNVVTGNEGANDLWGEDGNDTIAGGRGDDNIFCGAGNDSVNGGAGYDFIYGGEGNDTLAGGATADTFFYEGPLDGHDLIRGFDGNSSGEQDTVNLDSLFDGLGTATADRAGRVQITDRGANVDIRLDTDGDGSFELFAVTIQTSDAITVGPDILVGSL